MNPEHADLHPMVDRLDPDQVRTLRAVAQQLLRPRVRHPDSGEAQTPEPESLLADEPVRDFTRPPLRHAHAGLGREGQVRGEKQPDGPYKL